MAKADSVPSAIQESITGATLKASTNRPSILCRDGPAFPGLWRVIRAEVERRDLSDNYTAQLGKGQSNRRWYGAIAGRMPVGWHVAAVCYATAAILLGWWPWNFLLLLILFPMRNKRVRSYAFRTVAAQGSMPSRESYRCGSPT